jgi:hypothetical protein
MDDEENPRVRDEVINKGQLFESLGTVKFFFQDYVVWHHYHFMWRSQIKTYGTL